jgi:hypothetical protein
MPSHDNYPAFILIFIFTLFSRTIIQNHLLSKNCLTQLRIKTSISLLLHTSPINNYLQQKIEKLHGIKKKNILLSTYYKIYKGKITPGNTPITL